MLFLFNKRSREERRRDRMNWPTILVYLFVGYVVMYSVLDWRGGELATRDTSTPPASGVDPAKPPPQAKYDKLADAANIDRWRRIIDPARARQEISVHDIETGTGEPIGCGEPVVMETLGPVGEHEPFPEGTAPVEQRFRVGDGTVAEAISRGTLGMKQGGVRELLSGQWGLKDPPAELQTFDAFRFRVTVKESGVQLEEGTPRPMSVQQGEGLGDTAPCGSMAAFQMRVWNLRGDTLFSATADKPFVLRLGAGTLGYGIDRGLVDMRDGEVRMLVLPPSYAAAAAEAKPPFVAPPGEFIIVEAQRVAYNQNPPSNEPQPTPESSTP